MSDGGGGDVTIVRGGVVWLGDDEVERADVVITDGQISAITRDFDGPGDIVLDASDCLVLPGLINAHVHPGGTPLLRGIAEDLPLPAPGALYHNTVDFRLISWSHLADDEISCLVEWEAVAMLLGGATTIISEQVGDLDQWIAVCDRLGFRSDVGRIYPYPPHISNGTEVSGKSYDAVWQGLEVAIETHRRHDDTLGGRLTMHLAPHAPNTVPEAILRESAQVADRLGTRLHLHISQHQSENATVRERTKLSPVQYLDSIGFLSPAVLATHLTYTDDDDWGVIAKSGAHVVHSGSRKVREAVTGPFVELLDRGVNVCLATETYSHDLVDELKWSALLGKLRSQRVDALDAVTMLQTVTSNPAKALGRDDLGVLRVGARGDITAIALDSPFNSPPFDPLRNAVYYSRSADVRHTVVDGRPVVRDHAVVGVDMADLYRRAAAASRRVWQIAADAGALAYNPID